MLICKRKEKKKKKKKKRKLVRSMMWPLMWLNKSVATINATLQFLDIYIYIYIYIDIDIDGCDGIINGNLKSQKTLIKK